jgi:branched-chain amino acid transport system substrate-binding protein
MLSIRSAGGAQRNVILSGVGRLAAVTALVAVAMVAACTGSTPPAPAGKALDVGVDLPLSGSEARAAVPALYGVRFFVQTHPILDGFRVTLKTADDAAGGSPNPIRGASNVQDFLADPKLVAMIGPYDAAVARVEIPIANQGRLAMISPATSNPCLTRNVFMPALLNPARTAITCQAAGLPSASDLRPQHTNNFFRLTTTDELQGAAAADYAFHKLHLLRAAVITDHEAYGEGLAYAFTARFTSQGGTVLGRLDLDPIKPDATAFLKSMKDAGAQAIYYGGGTTGGGCAVRAEMGTVFSAGLGAPFLGGDGIAEDPACVSSAGDNSAGIFATVPIVDAGSQAAAATTIHDFKALFGNTSDYGPYTLVAYDATGILYAALDRAIQAAGGQLPDRPAVISEVARTSGLAGVTGTLGFDSAGDTTNRIVSIFAAPGSDPRGPWKRVDAVDYSAQLPY